MNSSVNLSRSPKLTVPFLYCTTRLPSGAGDLPPVLNEELHSRVDHGNGG